MANIYNIHSTSGDQFADVQAASKNEALTAYRLLKGARPGLRATKLQGDDTVAKDVIKVQRSYHGCNRHSMQLFQGGALVGDYNL
jgi:hypothetical protein